MGRCLYMDVALIYGDCFLYINFLSKSRVDDMQILYMTSLHAYFKRHCGFRKETVLKSSDVQECFISSALG